MTTLYEIPTEAPPAHEKDNEGVSDPIAA